jgi:hypothetical protein
MSSKESLPKLKSYLVVGSVSAKNPKDIKAIEDIPAEDFSVEFVQNLMGGELLQATSWEDSQRKWSFECALNDVLLQGFYPAFEHLQRIRAGEGQTAPFRISPQTAL